MNRLQRIALGATAVAIGLAAISTRTARLASVRITAIRPGTPSMAHIALTYSPGMRPVSVVIDITTESGSGSVTLDGLTLYCDIPLSASGSGPQQIATTAFYRSIGFTTQRMQQFN
ncbi:MAG: hypothetical protein SH847_23465 [Roseiflexaceae bacterium]|nr:hypothetical protein [Roseiflexaceae bacterium]